MATRELNRDAFLKSNEEAQSRRTGGGQDYFKLRQGVADRPARNVLRIMPPHEGMEEVFTTGKIHFSLGPDPKSPVAVNCLEPFGEECPACNAVMRLHAQAKAEDDADEAARLTKRAKDMAAKVRVYANIVDMDHPEKGVQRFAFGPDLDKKLRACFFDDDGEYRNITHPKTGRDVIVISAKKPGTDFTEYTVRPKESPSPLKDMDWLDDVEDLSELANQPSRDDVLKALKGERPKATATATASKKKSAPVDNEDEAPVKPKAKAKPAVDEEEEEEEEAPKAKAASKRQAVAEDDDDPWAVGRQACADADPPFVTTALHEITEDALAKYKKPACFTKEPDPTERVCQGCPALLPCLTAKLAA